MKPKSYFLWPHGSVIDAIIAPVRRRSISRVESTLETMFPSGHPVLCSSARAAIVMILERYDISRPDLVGVFPYASHCVLDAVARIATPVPYSHSQLEVAIEYHQWGYVQNRVTDSNVLIEDAVDSLCIPGEPLFPLGGDFEIWSLPKILGTTSGGIIWCKNRDLAEEMRAIRSLRRGGATEWVMRLLGRYSKVAHLCWQGVEPEGGNLSTFQAREILAAITKWPLFIKDRKKKLELLWPYAPDWLAKPASRLPTAVPISLPFDEIKQCNIGILPGRRIFELKEGVMQSSLHSVMPIPIHHEVPHEWIYDIATMILNKGK